MDWPAYFAQSLTCGSLASGVGLCLLWTPQDHVLPALDPASYALAGNLYSRDGVSFLVRNLLAHPQITDLLLCGREMTGSGAALVALWRDGLDADGHIIGEGLRLHADIPPAAVELLRRNVTLHDHREVVRPAAIAALLAGLPRPARAWAAEPLIFPYHEPAAEALPAAEMGLLLRGKTIRSAYLQLLWHLLRFGRRGATQHSSDQREILNLLTIVSDEPVDLADCSYADWMPFSRESLGERLPDGSYSGYLGQFLQAGHGAGLSYTYGERLRAFPAHAHGNAAGFDQVAALVAELKGSGASRRALASLWHPPEDAGNPGPPCLTLVQARLRDERLHLTAYFRSHDIYRAWPGNAFGLRALQDEIASALGAAAGELAILSHSAHIYAHDWARAEDLLKAHYRPSDPRLKRDGRGSFVVGVEPPDLVVRHYSPSGEHLQTLRGPNARELGLSVAPFIGEVSHAIYLGRELQKAELALHLGRAEAYHQDRALAL